MKTFLRENKLRLLFLGVPVLCLIALWSINFYKIWYDETNWQNLGPLPDATAVKIVDFQDETIWGALVLGSNGKIYPSGNYQIHFDYGFPIDYLTLGNVQQKRDCADKLRSRWGFKDQYFQDVKSIDAFGYCTSFVFDYEAFQIRENGEVWGKYFRSYSVDHVRNKVTLYFCIFLILAAPIWMKLFVDYDPLKPKPDYDAK